MQSVQVLISPLQILLFYPFIRSGRYVFSLDNKLSIPVKQIPAFIYNHTGEFVNEYLKIFMAGIVVWVVVSFIAGYVIYRVILNFFYRYQETKSKNERDAEDLSIKIKVPTHLR